MRGLNDSAGTLAAIGDNLERAGQRNTADEVHVIVREMRAWAALMDALYAETLEEIAVVEDRLGRRRQALTTGNVVALRGVARS